VLDQIEKSPTYLQLQLHAQAAARGRASTAEQSATDDYCSSVALTTAKTTGTYMYVNRPAVRNAQPVMHNR
jgi:hypothetical protein